MIKINSKDGKDESFGLDPTWLNTIWHIMLVALGFVLVIVAVFYFKKYMIFI